MTFANFVLCALFLLLLILNKKIKQVTLDSFFYVTAPYVVIILLNNLYWVNKGFYQISDRVIYIHILTLIIFFIGTVIAYYFTKRFHFTLNQRKVAQYNIDIKKLKIISVLCHVVVIADMIARYIKYGVKSLTSDVEEYSAGFLAGHIMNLLVPIVIISVSFILKKGLKDKSLIVITIISMLCIASAFVKYHIISTVIAVFIYCAIKSPEKIKKLGITVVILIIAFFVGTYMLDFAAQGVSVNSDFYLNHFWKYVAGSTINFESVEQLNCHHDLSIWLWLLENIMGFPNMFFLRLLGTKIPNYTAYTIPMMPVGNLSEASNVSSVIASIFIQSNMFEFVFVILGWGFIIEWARNRCYKTSNECNRIILSIFLAFNVLSFFSSFFVLSTPWEMMIMTYVVFILAKDRKLKYAKDTIQYL